MTSQVQSYSRHVNGKLVNVRAYAQSDGGGAVPSTDWTVRAGVHDRPPLAAQPGIFTHGLVPIALFPGDRDLPFAPTQLWIRKASPMQGLGGIGLSGLDDNAFIYLTGNAAQDWVAAVKEGINHVKLVITNNPGRDMVEILARPDVQQALQSAGADGAQAIREVINEIWAEESAPQDSPFLASVLNDTQRNADTFAPRMTEALATASKSEVQAVVLKDKLRASAAQSVIETRARMEATLNTYKLAGITHVQWKANFTNNTPCSYCAALDGEIVPIDGEFSHTAGGFSLPVYGELISPPRHPNCMCRLVPVRI